MRIGWFRVNFHTVGMLFTQAMTFPQELTLKNTPMGLRLCALPVKEIANYHTACQTTEGANPHIAIQEGCAFDISLECEASSAVQLGNYAMSYYRIPSIVATKKRHSDRILQ